jgi:large subunit ribosomal protein L5
MALARLHQVYKDDLVPKLMEEFEYKNQMEAPKLTKIVLNVGAGDAITDRKALETIQENLGLITGQHAVLTTAKQSISNFKLREGMAIGAKVTLRGRVMYEFLDRFINLTLPRTRDFQGIPDKGFDGRGNYNMGVKEHTIFPEIDVDKVDKVHGMDITFVTTAQTDSEAYALLSHFGMPFRNRTQTQTA